MTLQLLRETSAERVDTESSVRVIATSAERTASVSALDGAELLAAIQRGDHDVASELHDRLRPRVDATIRALLGPGHREHEDLVQQSLVEIVFSLDRYRGECSLETWAATISARAVFKYLRRSTTERKIFDHGAASMRDAEPPGRASFGRDVLARDLARRIREVLDTVDRDKAEAFLLHDICGFDAREVAALVGISEVAAHARIARGRRELHARIAADPELADALVSLGSER
jgi:RNA polymerase sigma factor (sigma-70 family)